MLTDQKNQYCEYVYTTKSNLPVQHILYQNSKDLLHRNRKINTKIHGSTMGKAILSKSPILEESQYLTLNYREPEQ
jgi:hypothetical protein